MALCINIPVIVKEMCVPCGAWKSPPPPLSSSNSSVICILQRKEKGKAISTAFMAETPFCPTLLHWERERERERERKEEGGGPKCLLTWGQASNNNNKREREREQERERTFIAAAFPSLQQQLESIGRAKKKPSFFISPSSSSSWREIEKAKEDVGIKESLYCDQPNNTQIINHKRERGEREERRERERERWERERERDGKRNADARTHLKRGFFNKAKQDFIKA